VLFQAVILCGGLGTRLGELTATTPKPLLPVAGAPFLDILIQEAARFGFTDILLLAGRFGAQIATRYDGRDMHGARVRVLIEPAPLGTGGTLRFAAAELAPAFLLMNGDSWIEADLTHFVAAWAGKGGALAAQMLLQRVPDAGRFGAVEISGGRVSAFREKDAASSGRPGLINAGVYVVSREIVAGISADQASSLETDILPPLVAAGRVGAVEAAEGRYFVDIGVPESYARAQTELPAVRTRPALFLDRDGTLNEDKGYTSRIEDLRWTPEAREAIALANAAGYYVFVVTNQAGVARGFYAESAILEFHRAMQADLFAIGAHIDAIEWCPHHIEGTVERYAKACPRRKPGGGMLADLIAAWPVDVSRSLLIGDSAHDVAAAEAVGVRSLRYEGGSLLELLRQEIES
jgi:D-glycero-D-manno-heptose 1,7-bisphosphate phosphatase